MKEATIYDCVDPLSGEQFMADIKPDPETMRVLSKVAIGTGLRLSVWQTLFVNSYNKPLPDLKLKGIDRKTLPRIPFTGVAGSYT